MMRKKNQKKRDIGLKDVADAAQVSLMTVSRALRGVEGVSEARRSEIQRLAKKMNYSPNNNARSLAVSNSTLVGISIPTLFADVFAHMLEGMRETFEMADLSTVVNTTNYERKAELAWVEHLLSWRPAGVVLTGCDHHRDVRRKLRRAGIPTLEIWDLTDKPIDVNVGIDHYKAGYELGLYVAGLGYRKPAFVDAPTGRDARAIKRRCGIESAFSEQKNTSPLMITVQKHTNSFIAGQAGTFELMGQVTTPDVIFYVNDHIAFGGMSACQSLGISVPDDIGIVGFNALDITSVLPVALTTVRTPRRDLGVVGARNLILRIKGVEPDQSVELPVEIIVGATTRKQRSL